VSAFFPSGTRVWRSFRFRSKVVLSEHIWQRSLTFKALVIICEVAVDRIRIQTLGPLKPVFGAVTFSTFVPICVVSKIRETSENCIAKVSSRLSKQRVVLTVSLF
jgi:hypothetical protein